MEAWQRDDSIRAWSALLRVHAKLVPTIGRELEAGVGLPLTWYDVLLELNASPRGRLRMQDLAEVAVLSRSRISRVVDELVGAGLVERVPNADDGRSAFAELTRAGRSAFRRAAPVYLAAVRRHIGAPLNTEERQDLRRALERLLSGPA